jgi:hypothetical protein
MEARTACGPGEMPDPELREDETRQCGQFSANCHSRGGGFESRRFQKFLPSCGRVHFLVHSWSNNCYLGFQSAVLVAIRAA